MAIVLPSIVMNMAVYIFAGEMITASLQLFVLFTRKRVLGIKHSHHYELQTVVLQLVFTIVLWLVLAATDYVVEKGNRRYLDCIYFAMITISTVGFGDMWWSAEKYWDVGPHYLLINMTVFLFSMGIFASTITVVNSIMMRYTNQRLAKAKMKIKSIKRKEENNNENNDVKQSNPNQAFDMEDRGNKPQQNYLNHLF